jgi:IS4 transposase
MNIQEILNDTLQEQCPLIHRNRLDAVLDVAEGLRNSQNLSMAAIGRKLSGPTKVKHKIKKVDRCLGNKHLHEELHSLYGGLSYFIFEHIKHLKDDCVVVDLCYLKDDKMVQMLSAQLCTRGMTLPIYQEIFKEGDLKGRTEGFLEKIKRIIPSDKKVVVIMDAGFHVEWFKIIETYGWQWVCRVRQGKSLNIEGEWISIKDYISHVGHVTKDQGNVLFTHRHKYRCRLVTTRKDMKGRKSKVSRGRSSSKAANGCYSLAAKEPWILATNLSPETHKASEIVKLYAKRMQIEESFRAIKSHRFGLSGRYVRTLDVNRWGVLMLLAAIVLVSYWIVGIIGHSQGMQKIFQVNTSNKRQFSYFTLGKLIIEHDKLTEIIPLNQSFSAIIDQELSHD